MLQAWSQKNAKKNLVGALLHLNSVLACFNEGDRWLQGVMIWWRCWNNKEVKKIDGKSIFPTLRKFLYMTVLAVNFKFDFRPNKKLFWKYKRGFSSKKCYLQKTPLVLQNILRIRKYEFISKLQIMPFLGVFIACFRLEARKTLRKFL